MVKNRFKCKTTLYSPGMQHVKLQSVMVFAASRTLETSILGYSVESRTPLENYFNIFFVFLQFKFVYAHIQNLNFKIFLIQKENN